MTRASIDRPVILGAGMAGLAAAAALRRHAPEVLVIERDRLPQDAVPRRGVPQGDQLHNLLTRAQASLERLLPGFLDALAGAGAGCARVARDTQVHELGIRMPERDLGMVLMCAPRPVVELVARRLLLAQGGVRVLEGTRVRGIVADPEGGIRGVRVAGPGGEQELEARLVVDATGTTSRAPRWLEAAGLPAPRAEHQPVAQWYVSARFRRPARWRGEDRFWLTFPPPGSSRGALVSPVGDDEWHVSVSGRAGDPRPGTIAGLIEHARSLEDPGIAELLAGAEPRSEPDLYRKPTARWRHYEAGPVPGFLPIGDAFVSLNPLFGQGMSVAAWQACLLDDALAGGDAGDLAALTRAYLREASAAAAAARDLGAAVDRAVFAGDGDGGPPDARRVAAFAAALRDDPALHRRYVRVWHLLEPAASLAGIA